MKKYFLLALLMLLSFSYQATAEPIGSLQPIEQSGPYKKLLLRPKTEISKLSFLIDRFREMNVTVIYEGHQYDAEKAAQYAKKFLQENYKSKGGGAAEKWVKEYCYRSEPSNAVIVFRYADKTEKPARDVMLAELEKLNHVLAQNKK